MAKRKKKTVPTKEINFRLIELPLHQFLVEKSFDEEENFTLVLTFYIGGLKITETMAFEDEEVRDNRFECVTTEFAEVMIKKVKKLVS